MNGPSAGKGSKHYRAFPKCESKLNRPPFSHGSEHFPPSQAYRRASASILFLMFDFYILRIKNQTSQYKAFTILAFEIDDLLSLSLSFPFILPSLSSHFHFSLLSLSLYFQASSHFTLSNSETLNGVTTFFLISLCLGTGLHLPRESDRVPSLIISKHVSYQFL